MQGSISRAAAALVITGDYERPMRKYSDRGQRFVFMEAGHAAQNVCLQAVSLQMGTVTVGAFNDSLVKRYLNLPLNEDPLYLIPIGKL
jgi:SagB-type dehydrogenase family enzyme